MIISDKNNSTMFNVVSQVYFHVPGLSTSRIERVLNIAEIFLFQSLTLFHVHSLVCLFVSFSCNCKFESLKYKSQAYHLRSCPDNFVWYLTTVYFHFQLQTVNFNHDKRCLSSQSSLAVFLNLGSLLSIVSWKRLANKCYVFANSAKINATSTTCMQELWVKLFMSLILQYVAHGCS